MSRSLLLTLWLALALLPHLSARAEVAPDKAFESLRALVGDWETKTDKGAVIRIHHQLISSDSVLVQTFTTPSGRQTMTLFHMDGVSFMATHYCAQGNQPRLRLDPASMPGELSFQFFDATNLTSASASHLHRLKIAIVDADHFVEIETYLADGKEQTDSRTYQRVKPKP
jgi:hypothetical protein